jgi:hypothetical protein
LNTGFDIGNLHRRTTVKTPGAFATAAAAGGNSGAMVSDTSRLYVAAAYALSASSQGLTLVHFSAQSKHILWDTLAGFSPSLLDRGTRRDVTKTA